MLISLKILERSTAKPAASLSLHGDRKLGYRLMLYWICRLPPSTAGWADGVGVVLLAALTIGAQCQHKSAANNHSCPVLLCFRKMERGADWSSYHLPLKGFTIKIKTSLKFHLLNAHSLTSGWCSIRHPVTSDNNSMSNRGSGAPPESGECE